MYTSYYGLSAEPFRLTPDTAFFFASTVHGRALAHLRYGVGQGEDYVVVTGAAGTGKTTLARSLLTELDASDIVTAHLIVTKTEERDLLGQVLGAFGLPHENMTKASLMSRFESLLNECAWDGGRILLIVDDAHHLSLEALEELRMLSNLQVSGSPQLQSFLLGDESLWRMLQEPQLSPLRQRVIAACCLDPLDKEETREYIEHRLQVAGWRGDPDFTEEACAAIHSRAQGIPRRINSACDTLMEYGESQDLHTFAGATVAAAHGESATATATLNRGVNLPLPDQTLATANGEPGDAAFGDAQETRLQALEQQIQVLQKQTAELEVSVKALRESFSDLARVLTRALKDKADDPKT